MFFHTVLDDVLRGCIDLLNDLSRFDLFRSDVFYTIYYSFVFERVHRVKIRNCRSQNRGNSQGKDLGGF